MTALQAAQNQICTNNSAPQVANIWVRFWQALQTHADQRAKRQRFNQMLTLPPHILKDIGITHDDVAWGTKLPIQIDAAKELEKHKNLCPMKV